ncbi:dual adapter for phosphotyrosine and 3-phosphotyrosine and 3-phosphoinositide-like isoform X2 [Branchiostoma floridae]|uniref:Dual adapter for phosphotyrosine and 3-phosphotyrosine and 3-phosphoinositide-like isoform X2 n=1 Tax=Branchiostoma floridae TaxID=7739 RepID=A0A9J7KUB0_BRAFL|nr:dual adapter for phosphotyrosine and 3-phosphotyrosine and 3-phosphoinositide-like isoform X2 [Branchiostoma floridae]
MMAGLRNFEVEQLDWYHGDLSRHMAEALLMANAEDGSYLLRSSATRVGEYSLSVKCKDSVKHFQIGWDGKQYQFGMGVFQSLQEFVEHFANQPLIGGESGNWVILLRHPYPRQVMEPPVYDQVGISMHWESGKTEDDLRAETRAPSIASKEGYLTKQGFNFKSWKTRWFVLKGNEMKYFRARLDTDALRVLDLNTCTGVAPDFTQNKSNCFSLTFPGRTFYMYANTQEEANEWMKLLKWKLEHKGQ